MACFSIKSTIFVLIITLLACFSSAYKLQLKGGSGLTTTDDALEQLIKNGNKLPEMVEAAKKASVEAELKKIGETLAGKFLGEEGKSGFRWGWKQGKRYLVAAKQCHKYEEHIKPQNCPRPKPKNMTPGCTAHCIVRVAMHDDTCDFAIDHCTYPVIHYVKLP